VVGFATGHMTIFLRRRRWSFGTRRIQRSTSPWPCRWTRARNLLKRGLLMPDGVGA
jgi:hypothetical protein